MPNQNSPSALLRAAAIALRAAKRDNELASWWMQHHWALMVRWARRVAR